MPPSRGHPRRAAWALGHAAWGSRPTAASSRSRRCPAKLSGCNLVLHRSLSASLRNAAAAWHGARLHVLHNFGAPGNGWALFGTDCRLLSADDARISGYWRPVLKAVCGGAEHLLQPGCPLGWGTALPHTGTAVGLPVPARERAVGMHPTPVPSLSLGSRDGCWVVLVSHRPGGCPM